MSPQRGAWAVAGEPFIAAQLTRLGFDWLCLDQQHGRFDDSRTDAVLTHRRDDAVPVYVRVRALDAGLIGRALDAGAAGVIVPLVESVEQARAAVAASRYPPVGTRSWGPNLGAPDRMPATATTANSEIQVWVMIETATALEHVEAIAAVPGVDGLFVGPFDLAIALGVQVDAMIADDSLTAPLRRILAAASEAGISAGAFGGAPARGAVLASMGFAFVAIATDTGLLELGSSAALAAVPAD
ncbi:HpcH/HpaI aldolase family protein [Lacisediminihabitans changchengi]|uniref:Aldolase n=1 Tax=Lacisediminihabitans changchengi TaxID=2787634 RepID=A0A934SQB5_9MICO|nr:aldolase/citrate lyase family protein [Lacisediminihabitans changchengi]MBK4346229.1 aldolase [Lacisediminihabitans changchengi]